MTALDELIERNDPDPLLREIDDCCAARDWKRVLEIRDRCNAATERGKTLWGVAEHANYRIALEAPGTIAATVVDTTPGPLSLGPLPEVIASTHTWNEIAASLPEGPVKGATAYECIALGEDLSGELDLLAHQQAFDMPLRTFSWEPGYMHAEYLENEARFPAPVLIVLDEEPVSRTDAATSDDRHGVEAWRNLVLPWLTQSNGLAAIGLCDGNVDAAILGADHETTVKKHISTENALQLACWAAASGGAHGRRRGLAAARSTLWWMLGETCGLLEDGMPHGEDIGDALDALTWWTWGDTDLSTGWNLRLAVHDQEDDISYAISAYDSVD